MRNARWLYKGLRLILAGSLLLGWARVANADIQLTFTSASMTGPQGGKVTFRASITNTGTQAVSLNQIGVVFPATDLMDVDPTAFYTGFAGTIAAGATIADMPIFDVAIDALTPVATYAGVVAIYGGADGNAFDNLAQEMCSLTVTLVDKTPPDTFITGGPADGDVICATSASFTFTGVDETSPTSALKYRWRIDAGTYKPFSTATTATLTALAVGTHVFEVAAKDEAGNVDKTNASRTFKVDTSAPLISSISSSPRDYRTTVAWITNKKATTQVEYGTTTSYGTLTTRDDTLAFEHVVKLTGLTPKTTYHFRVRSTDGCTESVSADQTFTTTDILNPDLVVTSLDFPRTVAGLAKIDVTWQVQNIAQGDAKATWNDGVYLSSDLTLDAGDTLLGTFSANNALGELATYSLTGNVQIPAVPPGNYYLIVKADSGNTIAETDETNNTIAIKIEVLKAKQLIATPDQLPLSLNPTVPRTVSFTMTNLGSTALTGIASAIQGTSPNVNISVTAPSALAAGQSATGSFTATASDESVLSNAPSIVLTSAEGQQTAINLALTIVPRTPVLVASPGAISTGMLRGKQTLVEAVITNTGGVAAEGLVVAIPSVSWMSLASPASLGKLNPGASARVVLSLMPPSTLALGHYTGNIVVNGTNCTLSVSFDLQAVSDGKGDLDVIAEDEFTYFADNHPSVANATVRLLDPQTGATVLQGVTDAVGHLHLSGVPEGSYNLDANADGHNLGRLAVQVAAGQVATAKPFLSRNLVTYQWNVLPVDTPDKYVVTLDAIFETNVPAPVVTVNPTITNLADIGYDANGKATVLFTVSNHGLIAAQNVRFQFSPVPGFELSTQTPNLGTLPALTTVVVPVTVQQKQGGQDFGLCRTEHWVYWDYTCGLIHTSGSGFVTVNGFCPPSGTPGGSVGPGLSFGGQPTISGPNPPVVSLIDLCDPCLQKRLMAYVKCAIIDKIEFKCPGTIAKETFSCLNAWRENGFLNRKTGGECVWSAMSIAMKCGEDFLKLTPQGRVLLLIWEIAEFTKCVLDIVNACSGEIGIQDVDSTVQAIQRELDRLTPLANAYTYLFGDAKWVSLDLSNYADSINWLSQFAAAAQPGSDGDGVVTAGELAALLASPLPSGITASDVNVLVTRWNRTLSYWSQGILHDSDVPSGQSHDFCNVDTLISLFATASDAEQASLDEYGDIPLNAIQDLLLGLYGELTNPDAGVCAKVRVRLDQDVTLSRTAFAATLEIDNSPTNVQLQNVNVSINVLDQNMQPVPALFGVSGPALTGLNNVSGTGTLDPGASGSAVWTVVPTHDAAPDVPTLYYVSGTLSYTEGKRNVVIPLFPTAITVKPDPFLQFHYFWQRDVYSDDPFTPEIEPAEPFTLGLLVVNRGKGTARNLQIASSQPQIVDNEKGLLIDFKIVGSQVNADTVSPSLTVNLGNIGAYQTGTARWLMTSSLAGKFIDYQATFRHVDDFGNPRTSLIDSVDIHALEHAVRVDRPNDDGKPDFLVDDIPDLNSLPDTLWNSDGTVAPVAARTNATVDGPTTSSHLVVTLTQPAPPAGYLYIRVDDPAQGNFKLLKVVRSDGVEIRMDDNAWTTHRLIHLSGQTPFKQHRLYIFDQDSTGSYQLIFGALDPVEGSVGTAKLQEDGRQVVSRGLSITGFFGGGFYAESPDRSSGIFVLPKTGTALPALAHEGSVVDIAGVMRTGSNGERYVEALNVSVTGAGAIEPLGITTRGLYGGDFFYHSDTGAGQRGMAGGVGLNSAGLLVRTLGKVTTQGSGKFSMDDGFGAPFDVLLPAGASMPAAGSFVVVTGVAGMQGSGLGPVPILLPRHPSDLFYDTVTALGHSFGTPAGLLNTGYNQFALPGVPVNPDPINVLNRFDPGNGSGLFGRLSRYDAPTQQEIFYDASSPAFGKMLLGDGFRLRADSGETKEIVFDGFRADFADFWLGLPKLGATLIGQPFDYPQAWENVRVNDGTQAIEIRDASKVQFPTWLDPFATYLNSATGVTLKLGFSEDPHDSTDLTPWIGYFATSRRDSLALIVPSNGIRPVITQLTPPQAPVGGPAFTLVVAGSAFTPNTRVFWNGAQRAASVISAQEIHVAVTAADLQSPDAVVITLENPLPGGGISNAMVLTISTQVTTNPAPTIGSLSPAQATTGDPDLQMTVNGSNFIAGTVVYWNNLPLATTYVSPTQVTAVVPAANFGYPGTADVNVFNPGPGGGVSGTLTFKIVGNPKPKITALDPNGLGKGDPATTIAVLGTGFVPQTVVQVGTSPRVTTFVSQNQVNVALPKTDMSLLVDKTLTAVNPAPGGGTSNSMTLHIGTRKIKAVLDTFKRTGNTVTAGFTISNVGDVPIKNVTLITATLSCTAPVLALNGTPVPQTIAGTLVVGTGAGSSAKGYVTFTDPALVKGVYVTVNVSGRYDPGKIWKGAKSGKLP